MKSKLEVIQDSLDKLQRDYLDEEDDYIQMEIERKFTYLLDEATKIDNVLRVAAGVTITNWVRETTLEDDN